MRKTVTGLFQDATTAKRVMQHLLDEGVDRNDVGMIVNLVGRDNDPFKQSKTRYWRRGTMDAPMGILIGLVAGLAIGALTGALIAALPLTYPLGTLAGWGAAIGGAVGAVCGGILNTSMPRILGQNLATVEKSGATLVQVRTREEDVGRVHDILAQHRPVELDGRRDAWGERGWEAYDPAAEPVR